MFNLYVCIERRQGPELWWYQTVCVRVVCKLKNGFNRRGWRFALSTAHSWLRIQFSENLLFKMQFNVIIIRSVWLLSFIYIRIVAITFLAKFKWTFLHQIGISFEQTKREREWEMQFECHVLSAIFVFISINLEIIIHWVIVIVMIEWSRKRIEQNHNEKRCWSVR